MKVLTVMLLLVQLTLVVRAGDDDTHYILTYYIARQVGYSDQEAHRIASATVSVDYDDNTKPVKANFGKVVVERHAMYDRKLSPQENERQIARQIMKHWNRAMETGNVGDYLHYMQDIPYHQNRSGERFGNKVGHGPEGHSPDYASYDPDRLRKAADITIETLSRFKKKYLGQEPRPVNKEQLAKVLEALKEANPMPQSLVGRALDQLPKPKVNDKLMPQLAGSFINPPDFKKAKQAVEKVLRESPDSELGDLQKIPEMSLYHYNKLQNRWHLSPDVQSDQAGLPRGKIGDSKVGQAAVRPTTKATEKLNKASSKGTQASESAKLRKTDPKNSPKDTARDPKSSDELIVLPPSKIETAERDPGPIFLDYEGTGTRTETPPPGLKGEQLQRWLEAHGDFLKYAKDKIVSQSDGPAKPPDELMQPGKEQELSKWLAKHPELLKRVLENNLPPEAKDKPILISDQQATSLSQIPRGWIECQCPFSHPNLGIFVKDGDVIRQFHSPDFKCP